MSQVCSYEAMGIKSDHFISGILNQKGIFVLCQSISQAGLN